MHYHIKQKVNKLDTNQNANLSIPQIDVAINSAVDFIVNSLNTLADLPTDYVRDSFRTLRKEITISNFLFNSSLNKSTASLPKDYRFYRPSKIKVKKEGCPFITVDLIEENDKDTILNFKPANTNYNWGIYYVRIEDNNIVIPDVNSSDIDNVSLTYIRNPLYCHAAALLDASAGYILPDGTNLTGIQQCELPEHLHEQVVNISSLILTQGLINLDYSILKDLVSLGSQTNSLNQTNSRG